MSMFLALLRATLRTGGGIVSTGGMAVFFTVLVGSLFGIALAPVADVLRDAAPAVIWLCALLAATLSLETLWHRRLASGQIDVLMLSGVPSLAVAGSGIIAHWLMVGVPLVLAGVVLAVVFALPMVVLPVLLLSLLCATLYLSLTGAMAAVLTFGARMPGILMVVLILPLQLPMLLLALMAVARCLLDPAIFNPYVYLQGALLLFALPLLAGGAAWLLRFQLTR